MELSRLSISGVFIMGILPLRRFGPTAIFWYRMSFVCHFLQDVSIAVGDSCNLLVEIPVPK
jgi:hypothetical protein